MSVARRIAVGGVALLAAAGMVLGAAAAVAGLQIPPGVAETLSGAGGVLAWLRLAVVLALVYRVARARENVV